MPRAMRKYSAGEIANGGNKRSKPTNSDRWLALLRAHLVTPKISKLFSSSSVLSLAGASVLFANPAFAQSSKGINFSALGSVEILMLASFGGAMSFALLAASWMIRERTRIIHENVALESRLTDIKAQFERVEALVNTNDQRVVVWDGKNEKPALIGTLSSKTGAPEKRGNFLAFGTWLKSSSCTEFEVAIKELRVNAKSFDLVVETKGGGILEVQGRTSGGHAFIRFIELSEERKSNAQLELDHVKLESTLEAITGLFDSMDSPVWLREKTGEIYWMNRAYAEAVGSETREAAVEKNIELFDENERNLILSSHAKDAAYQGELPAVVSGDRKTLEVIDVCVGTKRAGLAIDRSDKAFLQKTLSHIEASHAKMLDQLAAAVAIFDSSKHLQFFNSSFQKLWELDTPFLESNPSHGDLIDAIRSKNMLPEQPDWKKWREQQTEVYQSLEPIEDWWYLPDGQTLRVIASPQAQGGASWTFENVTERLALESNYNSLVRMQGETLDHLSEAVAVFGPDGRLRLSNPALKKLWGLSETRLVADATSALTDDGEHISELFARWETELIDAEQLSKIHQKVTDFDEERSTSTGRLELAGGRFLDYMLVPLPEGQVMLTLVDMSASVNIERALNERAEALEESDHIKSKFLQHVSYELRAPLTTIAGFGEMLTSAEIGTMNTKQTEYLDHINTSSDTLRAIIDDILDLATVDAGAMVLEIDRVNIGEIVAQSLEGVQGDVQERSLVIDQKISSDSSNLIADPVRLRQILFNLLSNAVKHSPDGGTILVTANSVPGFIEIGIEDEGEGIPIEARKTAFDRFETGISNKQSKGTGLGLSIVKSFVELHGGDVEIADGRKGGAKIICRLPLEPIPDSQAAE